MEMPIVKLSEVLIHNTDYIEPEPKIYPKLSVKLYGKGVVLDTPADGATLKMKRHQLAKPGQVILSEIWGKKGAIGLVPPEGDGALCTSHFYLFDLVRDKIEPGWLQLIFSANYLEDQLGAEAHGTTGYASVRPKTLLACEIPLPPLDEQRRIVAHIEGASNKIAVAQGLQSSIRDEMVAIWESELRSTFRPCEGRFTLEAVCEEIIDNPHSTPSYNGSDYPCVRSQDVGWGTLDYSSALRVSSDEYEERTRRGKPSEGDIVFVREGDIGRCAVVDGTQPFCLGQRVMMLRPRKGKMLPKYLTYQLMSEPVLRDQVISAKTGTTSHHVNVKHLRTVLVNCPDIDIQRSIVIRLDQLRARLNAVQDLQNGRTHELDALLPSILDKAFRGEL